MRSVTSRRGNVPSRWKKSRSQPSDGRNDGERRYFRDALVARRCCSQAWGGNAIAGSLGRRLLSVPLRCEAGSWPERGVASPPVRAITGVRKTPDVYPRVHGPLTVRTRRRGSGRIRAEANFPAREAEAHERGRDRAANSSGVRCADGCPLERMGRNERLDVRFYVAWPLRVPITAAAASARPRPGLS
jgi:hypothetical protein